MRTAEISGNKVAMIFRWGLTGEPNSWHWEKPIRDRPLWDFAFSEAAIKNQTYFVGKNCLNAIIYWTKTGDSSKEKRDCTTNEC